jgi:beta-glucosidase
MNGSAIDKRHRAEPTVSIKAIERQAQANDMAVFVLGRTAGEGADRVVKDDFELTAIERELLQNISMCYHKAGKKVVVIINAVGVVETASWKNMVDAILLPWTPGQEGAYAVADILTGKVNPSGRLTMTWPLAATDHPSTQNFPGMVDFYSYQVMRGGGREMPNYDYTNHNEDIYVGYRYFDTFQKEVSYPFGFGLSYTTFDFTQPKVKVSGDNVAVTVTVKNTGNVSGKEVVQVYVTAPNLPSPFGEGSGVRLEKPAQELKAFAKTRELQPGESQTLTMQIPVRMLASFDEQGSQWLTETGNYTFKIGSSSRDIKVTATAKLTEYTEKVNNVMAPQQALNLLKQ